MELKLNRLGWQKEIHKWLEKKGEEDVQVMGQSGPGCLLAGVLRGRYGSGCGHWLQQNSKREGAVVRRYVGGNAGYRQGPSHSQGMGGGISWPERGL